MYDVVIVGGRCAGSPLAMLLAKSGHKVLIVDRATFPSDTMSTHFIQSPGMARLARWGLMDDLFATGCPPVSKAFFDVAGDQMELDVPMQDPIKGLASPRRTILDKLLVDAAVAAGAELAEGISVDSLIFEDDRVVGIKGHGPDGAFEARGRFVVGADGRHSMVAEAVDAPFTKFVEPITGGYYNYFRGTGFEARTQLFFHEGFVCVMFPTHDDCTCVAIAWPREQFAEKKRDIEGSFNATLSSLGELGERVVASERMERFVGAADLANYIRRPHGPGWALVGDACYHKDPTPADGISDAFRGAEMLAEVLDQVLTEAATEDDAFAEYERSYNEVSDKRLDPAIRCTRFDLTPRERMEAFIEDRVHDAQEVETVLASTDS
jgi:flavin-dependent dehydrogenase